MLLPVFYSKDGGSETYESTISYTLQLVPFTGAYLRLRSGDAHRTTGLGTGGTTRNANVT